MKKNYLKPTVAVYNLRVEMQPIMISETEQPVTDMKADPQIKGHGNGFWQAPENYGIIDDENDDW